MYSIRLHSFCINDDYTPLILSKVIILIVFQYFVIGYKTLLVIFQVRTKSRDSQSSDSAPTPIPPAVLRGVVARLPRGPGPGPNQPVPGYRGPHQRPMPYQQHQQVIEHDENLSDKEIFPTSNRHDQHAAQVTTHSF